MRIPGVARTVGLLCKWLAEFSCTFVEALTEMPFPSPVGCSDLWHNISSTGIKARNLSLVLALTSNNVFAVHVTL